MDQVLHADLKEFVAAVGRVSDITAWPLRLPSFQSPSFWSDHLVATKARPLPANQPWTDYVQVRGRQGYVGLVRQYIATTQQDPAAVPGGILEYRWVYKNFLYAPDSVILPPEVERHVNRNLTHPWPAYWRWWFIRIAEKDTLTLQVRNLTGQLRLAFAAVHGWFYPSTRSSGEVTRQEGIDDAVRSC